MEKVVTIFLRSDACDILRNSGFTGPMVACMEKLYSKGYRVVRVEQPLAPGYYWAIYDKHSMDKYVLFWDGAAWSVADGLLAAPPDLICRTALNVIPPTESFTEWVPS